MTLWITHGYMLHILERNLKKCKVLGSLPVFFEFWLQFLSSNARRDLLRVLFVEKGEAVYCPGLFWALCCSYSILEVVYPDAAPWEQREHMWHILEKNIKIAQFWVPCLFFSEFWLQFLSSNARRGLLRVLFVEKGKAVYCPGLFWVLFCSYSILKVVYPDTAPC